MARQFLTPINLNANELQNFIVGRLSTTAINNLTGGDLIGGRLHYDLTANVLKYYDGGSTSWKTIATGGSTFYIGTQSISIGNSSGDVAALPGVTSVNGTTIPSSATLLTSTSTASALTSVGTLTSLTMGGNISLQSTTGSNGYSITGLKDPSGDYDAVNKKYVDVLASGMNAHDAVGYATTGNLTATYSNGTSGIGATLTNSGTQAAFTIDGYVLSSTDVTNGIRILVKDQTNKDQNGIYKLTVLGSASTNWELTRATDYDSIGEISAGDFTFVLNGNINAKYTYIQTSKPAAISGAGTAGNDINFTVLANGNISTIYSTLITTPSNLTSGTGSSVAIGAQSTDSGTGGNVTIDAGGGPSAPSSMGTIKIGNSLAKTITIGGVSSWGGTGTGYNQSIAIGGSIASGSASTSTLTIDGGGTTSTSANATGGSVTISGGAATGATGTTFGGNLTLRGGSVTSGSGTKGKVIIGDSGTSSVIINNSLFMTGTDTTQDGIVVTGRSGGTNSYRVTFAPTTLTANRSITVPDTAGTLLINPMSALGDIIYGGASGATTALSGSTSSTMAVLTQTGTGTVSAAPAWTSTTGTGNVVRATAPTIAGGSITGLTTFALRDTSAAYDVTLAAVSSTALTAGRTLTLDVVNAARTVKLAGNIDLAANFTTSGANALTLTTTASTNVTLPTSGTLLTTAGSGSSLTFGTGSLSLAGNLTTSGAYATTLTVTGATTVTLPTSGTLLTTAGSGSSLTFGTGSLSLAGNLTTSGAYATTITTTGTTSITLPTSGTLATTGANTFTGTQTVQAVSTQSKVAIAGGGVSTGNFTTTVQSGTLTADNTVTLPTATGTLALTSDTITGNSAGISGTQTANRVYAAPNGSNGTATFRALVQADLPTSTITGPDSSSLTVSTARKVTGLGPATSGTSITVTHNFAGYVTAQLYDVSSAGHAYLVETDVDQTDNNTVVFNFAASQTDRSKFRFVITG